MENLLPEKLQERSLEYVFLLKITGKTHITGVAILGSSHCPHRNRIAGLGGQFTGK